MNLSLNCKFTCELGAEVIFARGNRLRDLFDDNLIFCPFVRVYFCFWGGCIGYWVHWAWKAVLRWFLLAWGFNLDQGVLASDLICCQFTFFLGWFLADFIIRCFLVLLENVFGRGVVDAELVGSCLDGQVLLNNHVHKLRSLIIWDLHVWSFAWGLFAGSLSDENCFIIALVDCLWHLAAGEDNGSFDSRLPLQRVVGGQLDIGWCSGWWMKERWGHCRMNCLLIYKWWSQRLRP